MPRSKFSFLGVTCLVGGMLKIPHPKLGELNRFKAECTVLFEGYLDHSAPNRQAGLVVNWLGSVAGLTLGSLNLNYDTPVMIFEILC